LIGGRILTRQSGDFDSFRLASIRRPSGIEQRIGFQRLGNEALDLQIGRRQQLDCLLQLRRHHQRLRLPDIEAGAESHACSR
jgi:hypothetical protein